MHLSGFLLYFIVSNFFLSTVQIGSTMQVHIEVHFFMTICCGVRRWLWWHHQAVGCCEAVLHTQSERIIWGCTVSTEETFICFAIVSLCVILAQLVVMPSIKAVTSLFQFGWVSSRHQPAAALLFLRGLRDPYLGPADQQVHLCFGEPLQCGHSAGLLSWWSNSNQVKGRKKGNPLKNVAV